tara:strand:- start:32946 stop:35966 length:3021 start_codon:yes stop_codon:yes gene_type:complete
MKFFYLLLIIASSSSFAENFSSTSGAPIRQGVHTEWYRTVAPGNSGEAIFVWSDTRFGMRNIFAHKVNLEGTLIWGETGAVITNLPGRQEDPVAIMDGEGGAFIAWVDYRFDEEGDIFIQHIDTDGNLIMDPDGVALAQVAGKQITINMCTDSLGGVFVSWQDKRGGVDEDIYGTHISSEHEIIAPGEGVPIANAGGNQSAKSIEYAGNNEAFIAWTDFRQGANANIYGQRLTMDMIPTFSDNGIPIAQAIEQELTPRVTYINSGRSFVSWKEGDQDSRIYFQFIDSTGLIFDEAKSISAFESIQKSPRVKRSPNGEIFVNWTDLRDEPIKGDQYFQKINTNGDTLWGNGIRLDLEDDLDFSTRFAAGNNGDLHVTWERGTFPDVDIFYQNINSSGEHSVEEPINISFSHGHQFSPIVVGAGQNGLYIIYADQSMGSIDLKVQLINSNYEYQWINGGITAMDGLDGDVNYTSSYQVGDEDLYLYWEDNRSSKKIYGTRIMDEISQYNNGKQLTFGENSSSETDFSFPKLVYTDHGIFSATFDGSVSPKFIRINKFDSYLNNLWDSTGISVMSDYDMRSATLVGSGEGVGCFWSESRVFNYDIYFQRLDRDGNLILDENGIEIVSSSGDDYLMGVIPTPDQKFLIFWMEDAWPAAKLMYSKIDTNGNIDIGWNPNGNALSSPLNDSRYPQIKKISDSIGVLVVWIQQGNAADIYAQIIDWDGNQIWMEGGIVVSDDDNDQNNFTFDFNEIRSHSLLVWEDFSNGTNFEIFGKILNLETGEISSDPIQFTSVINDSLDNYNPNVKSIINNEFFVIWEDGRGYINQDPLLINGVDLYGAGYIIGRGMTTEINGVPICVAYHKQKNVNINYHSGDEFFLDWIDYRSSGKEDLANYYGRIIIKSELLNINPNCGSCNIPKGFSVSPAYPNPFNGKVNFDFTFPAGEAVDFKIYDIKGRLVVDKLILPGFGGFHRISWDGKIFGSSTAPAGIYLYKFKINNTIKVGKVTYLK